MGRRHRPVHQRRAHDGQPAAGQAGRAADDRNGDAGGLPDRKLRVKRALNRLRRPPTTVRWRLTLLYGGLFLICGAGLLVVTYTLVDHASVVQRPEAVFARVPPSKRNAPTTLAPLSRLQIRTGDHNQSIR